MMFANGGEVSFPVTYSIDKQGHVTEELGFDQKQSEVDYLTAMRARIDALKSNR